MISQASLKERLRYDPETNEFTWLKSYNNSVTGQLAGSVNRNGYVSIEVDGMRYYAHRLAWLYMTGNMPFGVIDHKDRNKTRNVFSNLRDVTIRENTTNQVRPQRNSSTGVRGVMPYRLGGYAAQICVHGVSMHLGVFRTIEAAEQVYLAARSKYAPLPETAA